MTEVTGPPMASSMASSTASSTNGGPGVDPQVCPRRRTRGRPAVSSTAVLWPLRQRWPRVLAYGATQRVVHGLAPLPRRRPRQHLRGRPGDPSTAAAPQPPCGFVFSAVARLRPRERRLREPPAASCGNTIAPASQPRPLQRRRSRPATTSTVVDSPPSRSLVSENAPLGHPTAYTTTGSPAAVLRPSHSGGTPAAVLTASFAAAACNGRPAADEALEPPQLSRGIDGSSKK